ncbi:hypothetical protein [Rodent Torque teno virus 6]|uniref:hypothetical protein n=1 Tax=Rodent Torque teno virus 6 TaxID=2054613 RepID=UPI000CA11E65|nr:hypothetical protein [Rodent Torque teno virus 6]ATX61874.1 hypothetical protein [Rodent Torque teno virus 6]
MPEDLHNHCSPRSVGVTASEQTSGTQQPSQMRYCKPRTSMKMACSQIEPLQELLNLLSEQDQEKLGPWDVSAEHKYPKEKGSSSHQKRAKKKRRRTTAKPRKRKHLAEYNDHSTSDSEWSTSSEESSN